MCLLLNVLFIVIKIQSEPTNGQLVTELRARARSREGHLIAVDFQSQYFPGSSGEELEGSDE